MTQKKKEYSKYVRFKQLVYTSFFIMVGKINSNVKKSNQFKVNIKKH